MKCAQYVKTYPSTPLPDCLSVYFQDMAVKKAAKRETKKETKVSEIIPESSSIYGGSFAPRIDKKNKQKRPEKSRDLHFATSGRRTPLQDDVTVANETIKPSSKDVERERRRKEKLKVVYSGTRRESLVDQLLFAINTITPNQETREKDKKAHEKRAVSSVSSPNVP